MNVKCTKVDVSLEKRILIGFIVSTDFLKNISLLYKKEYFSSHASRIIIKWCISFFKKYNVAPGKHITDIYLVEKREGRIDDNDEEFIESLLSSLSDEWETIESSFNSRALIDQCISFFNEKNILLLHEKINQLVADKEISSIEEEFLNYKPLKVNNTKFINPLSDEEAIRSAFQLKTEPLFKLPGALGKFLNPQLYKGAFIAFQGPEKSMKSYLLQELVMRALRNRAKVALFELGDMIQEDRICRIGSYTSRRPFVREKIEEGIVKCKIPELLEIDGDYVVKFNEVNYPILTEEAAIKSGKEWIRRCGDDTFRLCSFPSDSTSISDLDLILQSWKDIDDWEPDFIGIDYADIAAEERPGLNVKDVVNVRWKAMRRMSQERNALVVTVTQADAGSYGKSAQSLKNFSEDKRKYSHVTAMYAINQTLQERAQNTTRLAPLVIREGAVDFLKHIAIVHCLDLGRPYMYSYEIDATKFNSESEEED